MTKAAAPLVREPKYVETAITAAYAVWASAAFEIDAELEQAFLRAPVRRMVIEIAAEIEDVSRRDERAFCTETIRRFASKCKALCAGRDVDVVARFAAEAIEEIAASGKSADTQRLIARTERGSPVAIEKLRADVAIEEAALSKAGLLPRKVEPAE